jgi:beta-galactosidase
VALGRWLRTAPDPWADRPASVTVTSARNPAGDRVLFISNWSWEAVRVALPVAARDLLSGADHGRDGQLNLRQWDMRVLVEGAARETNRGGSL